jgi:hypothetical protein
MLKLEVIGKPAARRAGINEGVTYENDRIDKARDKD